MKRQQTMKIVTALALAAGFAFSATHPAIAVQTFSVVTCALATPTPCVGGTNTSTGPGVQGISSLGFGNVGQTKFNSTSTTNAKAGILGQDLSTTGINDEGVRGTSVRGLGVHGISSSRSGVRGDATSAQGVFGSSSSNAGAQGVSVTGTGVIGQSTSTTGSGNGGTFTASGSGNGISASASTSGVGGLFNSTSGSGVDAFGNGGGAGLFASSASGTGAFIFGATGAEIDDHTATSNHDILFLNGHGTRMFRANNSVGADVFTLQDSGQITAAGPLNVSGEVTSATFGSFGNSGTITGLTGFGHGVGVQGSLSGSLSFPKAAVQGNNTSDSTSTAVYANGFGGRLFVGNNSLGHDVFIVDDAGIVHAHGFAQDLAAASPRGTNGIASAPSLEDYGEARLSGGTAYVALKSTFGAAIDRNQPYLVFITPQGAVRGTVYVAAKDSRGFTVREAGGVSSVPFDYRIVAKAALARTTASSAAPTISAPKTQLVPPRAIQIHKTTKRYNAPLIPKSIH